MSNVLITGGAGYIGSVTTLELVRSGYSCVVLDSLEKGHAAAVPKTVPLIKGDIGDKNLIGDIVRTYKVDRAIHFAAYSLVGESVASPEKYFENNLEKGARLIAALVKNGVKRFVLSSTAAVYGAPAVIPIQETHPPAPENPYGVSKHCLEWLLNSYHRTHGLEVAFLRYFNAAGADVQGNAGEDHSPETHLIPILFQTALKKREKVYVFGNDYATPDGTAIRDYIHVSDLARAHILVLEAMGKGLAHQAYNLGIGKGYSVLEVLKAAERVSGKTIPYEIQERRAGDPPVLVADNRRFTEAFGWCPRFEDLDEILASAWTWHKSHPDGYNDKDPDDSL